MLVLHTVCVSKYTKLTIHTANSNLLSETAILGCSSRVIKRHDRFLWILLTLPLECGIPNGQCCTAPSRAAIAALYPATASGQDLSAFSLSEQRSSNTTSWAGSATAMQRRHQAAASRADKLGWRSTEITLSNIPERDRNNEKERERTKERIGIITFLFNWYLCNVLMKLKCHEHQYKLF